jgi:hypothetical protein
MRGQDFRRATPSRVGLSSLGVGKLDQAFDLGDGQGREAFAEFVDSFSEVEAVNDTGGGGHENKPSA